MSTSVRMWSDLSTQPTSVFLLLKRLRGANPIFRSIDPQHRDTEIFIRGNQHLKAWASASSNNFRFSNSAHPRAWASVAM